MPTQVSVLEGAHLDTVHLPHPMDEVNTKDANALSHLFEVTPSLLTPFSLSSHSLLNLFSLPR